MAMALTAFEDSVCSGCGQPASIARGDHNVGRLEVVADEIICHGCEALESHRESEKDKHQPPGQKTYLRDAHSEAPTQ